MCSTIHTLLFVASCVGNGSGGESHRQPPDTETIRCENFQRYLEQFRFIYLAASASIARRYCLDTGGQTSAHTHTHKSSGKQTHKHNRSMITICVANAVWATIECRGIDGKLEFFGRLCVCVCNDGAFVGHLTGERYDIRHESADGNKGHESILFVIVPSETCENSTLDSEWNTVAADNGPKMTWTDYCSCFALNYNQVILSKHLEWDGFVISARARTKNSGDARSRTNFPLRYTLTCHLDTKQCMQPFYGL